MNKEVNNGVNSDFEEILWTSLSPEDDTANVVSDGDVSYALMTDLDNTEEPATLSPAELRFNKRKQLKGQMAIAVREMNVKDPQVQRDILKSYIPMVGRAFNSNRKTHKPTLKDAKDIYNHIVRTAFVVFASWRDNREDNTKAMDLFNRRVAGLKNILPKKLKLTLRQEEWEDIEEAFNRQLEEIRGNERHYFRPFFTIMSEVNSERKQKEFEAEFGKAAIEKANIDPTEDIGVDEDESTPEQEEYLF